MPKLKKATRADMSAATSNNVVVQKFRNQTVLSNFIAPKKSKSVKKKKTNDRFSAANAWAKGILKLPGMEELYSRGINKKLSNSHTVAVRDFMLAPKIHYINLKKHTGAVGDQIRIKVTDDFKVAEVKVYITNRKGKVLESGPAIKYGRKPSIWVYTLTEANTDVDGTVIKVRASDLPGNDVIKQVTIENKV